MTTIRQGSRLHKLKDGQAILLDALFKKHGGLRASALKIGKPVTEGQLNMWRKRGKVPVKHVPLVANKLGVPSLALNYVEMVKLLFFEEITISWSDIVKQAGFGKDITNKILRAKKPKL